jgi:hypothetical protein
MELRLRRKAESVSKPYKKLIDHERRVHKVGSNTLNGVANEL